MTDEKFTTSSGKEITVHFSDQGEPERISFPEPISTLTENEIFDIRDYLESLDDDD